MHFKVIIATLLSSTLSSVLASPTAKPEPAAAAVVPIATHRHEKHYPVRYHWHVTHFSLGCSPGGCGSQLIVTGRERKYFPAFNTTCGATSYQLDYVSCVDNKHIGHYWEFVRGTDEMIVHLRYKYGGEELVAEKRVMIPPYHGEEHFQVLAWKSQ